MRNFFWGILIVGGALFLLFDGAFVLSPSGAAYSQELQVTEPHGPYHGTGVYVINLDRCHERYAAILPKIKALGLPFQKIKATEGIHLPPEKIHRLVEVESHKNYLGHGPKKGAIGCSLSHLNAWKAFLESSFEYALIFEDDMDFDPLLLGGVLTYLRQAPHLWDIVMLDVGHHGMPVTVKSFAPHINLVIYLFHVSHGGAYLISRSTAQKLMAKYLPTKMDVDHYFTRSWEFEGLKLRGIERRVVHQTYAGSDIANSQKVSPELSFLQRLHRVIYVVKTSVMRVVHGLWQYAVE